MSAITTTGSAEEVAALVSDLVEVAQAIPFVEKRGTNAKQGYNFAQATDVLRDCRAQLHGRGILVIGGVRPGSIDHVPPGEGGTGGRSYVTHVDLVYRFMKGGASIEVPWIGAGADLGGEKGVYKALTGGLKYLLLQTFLLPTSDDPENDALTVQPDQAVQAGGTVAKDADRPAAPPIPVDRAKTILAAAVAAELAELPEGGAPVFSPVLKAQLQLLGVEKIGQLNSDTAEELEAFIAAEHAARDEHEGEAQS